MIQTCWSGPTVTEVTVPKTQLLGMAGQLGSTWKTGAWRACAVTRVNAEAASTSAIHTDATKADTNVL